MRISLHKNFKRKFDEWKIPYLGGGSRTFRLALAYSSIFTTTATLLCCAATFHDNEENCRIVIFHGVVLSLVHFKRRKNFYSVYENWEDVTFGTAVVGLLGAFISKGERREKKPRVFLSNGKDLASLRPWVFWGPWSLRGALKAYKWHYEMMLYALSSKKYLYKRVALQKTQWLKTLQKSLTE